MSREKTYRIHLVFLGLKEMKTGWPYSKYDVEAAISEIRENIGKLSSKIDRAFEFCGWNLVENDAALFEKYEELSNADGLIVVPLTAEFAALGPDIFKLAELDLPMIVYTPPFATYWDGFGSLYANGVKAVQVASSDYSDLLKPLQAMKAVIELKKLRLLVIRDLEHDYTCIDPRMLDPRWKGPAYVKQIKNIFGTQINFIQTPQLMKSYQAVQEKAVQDFINSEMAHCTGSKEPSAEEINRAVRMYFAIGMLMKEHDCGGVTVDCLSYIRENKHPISPCFALSRLAGEGFVAGCEADVESTLTLALCLFLSGHSGFQSDPVIDVSKNQVLFAHCTAAPNVTEDQVCSFCFRSHNESLSNVGVEVDMPVGKPVTILKLLGKGKTDFVCWPQIPVRTVFEGYHLVTREAVTVPHGFHGSDRGCRTKVAVELPPDEVKAFGNHFYGHHRIVLYGQYQAHLQMVARFLGIEYHSKMYLELE